MDLAIAGGSEYRVRSGAAEGITGVIERAWRAPGHCPRTFVAVAKDERTDCTIEVSTREGGAGPVLGAVTVRARLVESPAERALTICRQAFAQFGATRYSCLAAHRGAASGFDITLCFPDIVPWLAENTLCLPALVALDDIPRYCELLSAMGVRHRATEREIVVSRLQLRLRPSMATLMEAFALAVSQGFRSSLYAAALPVTHSVRIEQAPDFLDVAISKGLSRRPCSHADLKEMDQFCREWLGIGRSALEWRVRANGISSAGKRPNHPRPAPSPAAQRRPALRLIEGGLAARA